ncbi:MAG: hypothetical protein R3E12_20375, partial [Candidatus Eisenbacteria bacterium]
MRNGLRTWLCVALGLGMAACSGPANESQGTAGEKSGAEAQTTPAGDAGAVARDWHSGLRVDDLIREGERHFRALYQLTTGGENAEAYFSWDGTRLILQVTPRDGGCDQIFVMPTQGGSMTRLSNGEGRCTCAYFLPGDQKILYSSTYETSIECPPKPDYSRGYVWPIYASYEIYVANADGSDPRNVTHSPGYDAEATIGADGTVVFTSTRDGDLDIYTMQTDGSDVRRLTDEPGYDGGPFFSPDGQLICYRAAHPTDEAELADYRSLLADGLIRPGKLDIRVM